MRTVEFYFGIGSRYSYLAAPQLPALAKETGARFVWRAVDSRELIDSAGNDPFQPEVRRGQYVPAYRARDAKQWADYYGLRYVEPDWMKSDWKRAALACVAADRMGKGEAFASRLSTVSFGGDGGPVDDDLIARVARDTGIDEVLILKALDDPETVAAHTANVAAARAAGAFGVPTFVVDDGALFWGQDRLPLLRRHLLNPSP